MKGKGIGRVIYTMFEEYCKEKGAESIRIDVVNSYEGGPYGFWSKVGFRPVEPIQLEWNGKKLKAIVMKKEVKPVCK